ncbi:MAG: ssDNA-binding domain-containing protein [Chitinophagales bacterium]|nr:ssDNA-binding domain-containing protein [Chitinophagales bacterium]
METTFNVTEAVTEQLIALLDKVNTGDIEYWLPLSGLAYNPVSKNYYTSINQLLLSFELQTKHYSHNNWLTFKQISEAGGSVIKGEKSSLVTFTDVLYFDKDENKLPKNEVKEMLAHARTTNPNITLKDLQISSRWYLKYYLVFNVAQTTGLPEELVAPELVKLQDKDRFEIADKLVNDNGVVIKHVSANSAHYDPINDIIQMPFLKQFASAEQYYATLFHEVIHWTNHESRLQRPSGMFGTPEYAFEELIAELGSAFICSRLQIHASLTSSSAYIKSWLSALEDDRKFILKAVSFADKAMQYVFKNSNHQL